VTRAPRFKSHRPRRGVSIIYVGIAMLVLIGIVSLAVDLGRVRMVRAQMQAATDAAAFAAVMEMPAVDFNAVEDAAIDIAAANQADNSSVVVKSADVEFGKWNADTRTFKVLAKGNGGPTDPRHAADAIRVTATRDPVPLYLAKAIGVTKVSIQTVATAYIRGGPDRFGIVGLDFIDAKGNPASIDSYPAATNIYSKLTARDRATVASNGDIDLQNGDVLGDARPGVDGVYKAKKNGGATGWTANLQTPLAYPPASVPPGAFQLPNQATPIDGGSPGNPKIYKTTNFPLNKTTTFKGPVRIYVTGSVDLKGNTVVTAGNLPSNLQIFVVGPGPVSMNGTTAFYAHVYAPQAPLDFHGTPDFYGTIVAKSILYKGTADIHYDESVGISGDPFRAALVQ
jgi:Flp pilus assembly protein TadG